MIRWATIDIAKCLSGRVPLVGTQWLVTKSLLSGVPLVLVSLYLLKIRIKFLSVLPPTP